MNRHLMTMFNEMQVQCPECKVVSKYESMAAHHCVGGKEELLRLKEENQELKMLVSNKEQKI